MDQKVRFVSDYLRGTFTVTELCQRYGVSRKTGYKWIGRYVRRGPEGLEDYSKRPYTSPTKTPDEIEALILQTRKRHPSWGGKKILQFLTPRHPNLAFPSRTTVCNILKRHGVAAAPTRRRKPGHPGKPDTSPLGPNELWAADYKGEFKTRNGIYCYPLTITDDYSRMLLACQSLLSTKVVDAKRVFTRIFREYGLPARIRTDNGVPFATNTLGRLSKLSAWWVRLGVIPEFIQPGRPQQNGRHERMHRTLKREATRPPAGNLNAQQRKFNTFVNEFNHERPHDALDGRTPAQCYQASSREMPYKIPPIEYPDRFEVRLVSANGGIRWNRQWVCASTTLASEYIGFEEIDDGVWDVWFGSIITGRFHERMNRIEDAYGRIMRQYKAD
ncbi:MAG: IS481 family transposase [Pseudomonadota bacterium]